MGIFSRRTKITDGFLEEVLKIIENAQESMNAAEAAEKATYRPPGKPLGEGDAKRFDIIYEGILQATAKDLRKKADETASYRGMYTKVKY